MKPLFSLFFLFLTFPAYAVDIYPRVCKDGPNYSKSKQFVLYVFCDDALGTNVGIIAVKGNIHPGSDPKKWHLTNRFWQEGAWATDVDSYQWSNDGNHLFISTSDIYGTGKKYKLDLHARTYAEVGEGHHED